MATTGSMNAQRRFTGETADTRAMADAVACARHMISERRYRVSLGTSMLEVRAFAQEGHMRFSVRGGGKLLIVPLAGEADVESGGVRTRLVPDEALLLLRSAPTEASWSAGSLVLVFHMPLPSLQAAFSRRLGGPVRVLGQDVKLELHEADAWPRRLAELLATAMTGEGGDIRDLLIRALERQNLLNTVTRPSASLRRVLDYIHEDCFRSCDPHTLALVAGITERKLRDSFHKCMGLSLSAYVQRRRLEAIREAFITASESRPLQELALQAGFASASAFSRAYTKAFGEMPVKTRSRSVHNLN